MSELLIRSTHQGVTTLTMNNPRRLNGWTGPMMEDLKQGLLEAARDPDCKVLVLTGTDPYYCAGVNLSGAIKLAHPRKLHRMIVEHNQALFEAFLTFPKPILVAANGPSIGAAVTTSTLCDGILASPKATFSTPFARLGVPPEGCSSVLFEAIMGAADATRMLGPEGWAPTGAEAVSSGLATHLATSHETLREEAQALAEAWIAEGRTRTYRGGFSLETLLSVNAEESVAVADAFLSRPFLRGQARFLWKKRKRAPALVFATLWITQPAWSRLR